MNTKFIPVAMADVVLRFVDYTALGGALILTATWIAVLVVLGLLLRRMPASGANTAFVTLPLIALVGGHGQQATPVNAFSALLFYVFFLGLGEELLFRGYIQSRLNIAFGRPFKLFGVPWGWGAVIASALFGLMHVLNLAGMISQSWQLTPWWGLWTFSFGLVMAFVREKAGSIVAPTLLHGLPQGIAYAFMGL